LTPRSGGNFGGTGHRNTGLYVGRPETADRVLSVLAHGSSILVSSSEVDGTTFEVRLPRFPPRQAA
jgi:signal transduction histidine kinase